MILTVGFISLYGMISEDYNPTVGHVSTATLRIQNTNDTAPGDSTTHHTQSDLSTNLDRDTRPRLDSPLLWSVDNSSSSEETRSYTIEDQETNPRHDSSLVYTVDNRPPPVQPLDHVVLHGRAQPWSDVGPKSKVIRMPFN